MPGNPWMRPSAENRVNALRTCHRPTTRLPKHDESHALDDPKFPDGFLPQPPSIELDCDDERLGNQEVDPTVAVTEEFDSDLAATATAATPERLLETPVSFAALKRETTGSRRIAL